MKIKLKEVLWEVTNKCNRNCAFCGSKEIINVGKDTSQSDRKKIAEEIASMAEVVTFTGGEPLLLSMEDLLELKEIFDKDGTIMDLVTNGDKLTYEHFALFRNIGISVNSKKDVLQIKEVLYKISKTETNLLNQIVFISNMNKINFFELDDIISAASENKVVMQFQLTMYKGQNNEMLDGSDIVDLRERIKRICKEYEVNYVLADNLQEYHECTAGIYSCGILYNGLVVPCLSERSWTNKMRTQGNVLNNSLMTIWMTGFKQARFGDEFECCRDCFNYVKCVKISGKTAKFPEEIFNTKESEFPEIAPIMMLYGVTIPNRTGNPRPTWKPQTYMYGVTKPFKGLDSEC